MAATGGILLIGLILWCYYRVRGHDVVLSQGERPETSIAVVLQTAQQIMNSEALASSRSGGGLKASVQINNSGRGNTSARGRKKKLSAASGSGSAVGNNELKLEDYEDAVWDSPRENKALEINGGDATRESKPTLVVVKKKDFGDSINIGASDRSRAQSPSGRRT